MQTTQEKNMLFFSTIESLLPFFVFLALYSSEKY